MATTKKTQPTELTWTIIADVNDRSERSAEFSYIAHDPYVITMTILGITWCLSRELLADGLAAGMNEPVGLGQVTIGPAFDNPERIEIFLCPPRRAPGRLTFPRAELEALIADVYAAVPSGTESVFFDWDEDLRFITGPIDPGPDGPTTCP